MSRLTKRDSNGKVTGVYNIRCMSYDETKAILEKLAHYEDLEEQGRLIEQKHGMWIRTGAISYRCSECNYLPLENDTAFCPNCGAKMELKELEGVKE